MQNIPYVNEPAVALVFIKQDGRLFWALVSAARWEGPLSALMCLLPLEEGQNDIVQTALEAYARGEAPTCRLLDRALAGGYMAHITTAWEDRTFVYLDEPIEMPAEDRLYITDIEAASKPVV